MYSFLLLRPYFIFLIIPCALLIALLYYKPKQSNTWESFIDKNLLDFLLPNRERINKHFFLGLIFLAWFLVCLALVGPSFKQHLVPTSQLRIPRVILLDLSENMQIADISPSRIARAKFKLNDLIEQDNESEISLVVFSEEPFLVSPFTKDKQTLLNFLERLSPDLMPTGGQNIQKALSYVESIFNKNHLYSGQILLVTASIPNEADNKIAKALAKKGIQVSVLGIGERNQLPGRAYQKLSDAGAGIYRTLSIDNHDINDLIEAYQKEHLRDEKQRHYVPVDSGYYVVYFIALLVLLGFRRGWFEQLTRGS